MFRVTRFQSILAAANKTTGAKRSFSGLEKHQTKMLAKIDNLAPIVSRQASGGGATSNPLFWAVCGVALITAVTWVGFGFNMVSFEEHKTQNTIPEKK